MNTHKLDTRLTSRAFREAVLTAFPQATQPEHLRLLLLLLLAPWLDDHGRTVLPLHQLASCAGAEAQAQSRNFHAAPFLADFEAHALPLDLREARWASTGKHSKARTACPSWPEPVRLSLETELSLTRQERQADAVYFVSGKPYKSRQHKEQHAMYQRQALERLLEHDHPALDLMRYANTQQSTVFYRLVDRNIDAARAEALAIVKRDKAGNVLQAETKAAQFHALRLLHGLESDAMPTYKPSEKGRTVRIFSDGLSYLGLPKAVRRVLMPGCCVR